MPILDLQKRARELGRIRLGEKGSKGQPQKLDRFRFTSHSKELLEKVAKLYGGEVREWTPTGGTQQWEVISNATRVPIMVPPQPVTQWHEAWRKSGCAHRCDGRTNVLTDELCDPEDPLHQEALEKPTTRLNVVLGEVEGIGVWRVETHGWNAALELPDVAQFLAQVGGYVNGWLSLEQRTSIDNSGEKPITRHYLVPIIEVDVTPAQLMAGGGARQQIAGGPQAAAITSGQQRDWSAEAAACTDIDDLRKLWTEAAESGDFASPDELKALLQPHVERLTQTSGAGATGEGRQPPAAGGAPVPDTDNPDAVWQAVLAEAGRLGMDMATLEDDFAQRNGGVKPETASAGELSAYLDTLKERAAA